MINGGARKTVLLVEDEVLIAIAQADKVKDFGYDVVMAHTGEEAIQVATGAAPVDLVLMDIDLGRGMNGPEAAERILQSKSIPILFLTSHAEREMVEKVHGITRYGYVIKNSGDFVLQSSIEMAFELFEAHRKVSDREVMLNHSQRVARLGHYELDIVAGKWTSSEMLDEIFGISGEYERSVEGWLKIVHPDDRQEMQGYLVDHVLGHKEPFDREYRIRNILTGETVWVSGLGQLEFDGAGNPVRMFGIIQDINEKKIHESALRESEERFQSVVDHVGDGYELLDGNGRFVDVNETTCLMLGYTREEMLRMSVMDIDPINDRSRFAALFHSLIGTPAITFETRHRRKDGTELPVEITASVIRLSDGYFSLAMVRDITNRKKIEDEKSLYQEELERFFDLDPDLVCIASTDGYFKKLNHAWEKTLGFSTAELLASPFESFIHPDDIEPTRTEVARQLGGQRTINFINRYRTKRGDYRLFEWVASPSLDGTMLFASARDITERKKTEDEIAERRRFIETLVNLNPDILYIYDIFDRKNIYSNEGIQKVLGHSAEDVLNMGERMIPLLMHPDDLTVYLETIVPRYAALLDGDRLVHSYRMKHKEGGWRWLESTEIIYQRLPDGAPRRIFGSVHDITDRRQAEEALRGSEEKFRTVADFTYDWEYWLGPDGKYIYVSPSCEAITGYAAREFMEDPRILGRMVHPDDREMVLAHLRDALTERDPHIMDFRIVTRDGETRWIGHQCQPVYGPDGAFMGRRGSNRNITVRRVAEDRLKKSFQEKDILLKELQHRVKNNLNVIYSLLGFEMDRLTDPEAREIFNNARSRILSMSSIYERLYQQADIERLELGQYIREFSESLFEMYVIDAGKYRFSTRVADITLDLKRSVPLGLILNELISNALKYAYPAGGGGEIRIELDLRGDTVRLAVSDDGRGLPEGVDPKKISSMGFTLVRMLADQIGGNLSVKSRPGKGTTMAVEFKLEPETQ